jgi:hypothetical protein
VDPIIDQTLGMGEQVTGMIELSRNARATCEHLRKSLGRRLQQRQEIARRVRERPMGTA